MWDLPRPGIEPVYPALAGGFLTTAPPGNSSAGVLILNISASRTVRNKYLLFKPPSSLFSGIFVLSAPMDSDSYHPVLCFRKTHHLGSFIEILRWGPCPDLRDRDRHGHIDQTAQMAPPGPRHPQETTVCLSSFCSLYISWKLAQRTYMVHQRCTQVGLEERHWKTLFGFFLHHTWVFHLHIYSFNKNIWISTIS